MKGLGENAKRFRTDVTDKSDHFTGGLTGGNRVWQEDAGQPKEMNA